MRGFAGTLVFLEGSVLLVQVPDYFTGEPMWTLPSGGMEAEETPTVAAARELAEESGCRIDPADLQPIATVDVEHRGEHLSRSWNFVATTTNPRVEPADPDDDVLSARWFDRAEAVELLSLHRYDPIREPITRYLRTSDHDLHWTFELIDVDARIPSFRWSPPVVGRRDH